MQILRNHFKKDKLKIILEKAMLHLGGLEHFPQLFFVILLSSKAGAFGTKALGILPL